MKCHFIFLLLLLTACGPRSPEDCRARAESLASKLSSELEQIHSSEDLGSHAPRVRILYEQLADVMLALERQADRALLKDKPINWELSARLERAVVRVYQIEGGREMLERAQQGALLKLSQKRSYDSVARPGG